MLIELLLYSGFAGITVLVGGLLANYFNHHIEETPVKYEITHTMMAFGGGIILSAAGLVLVPKGMEELTLWPVILCFGAGALVFYFIDKWLASKGGQMSTLLAMLMDFVPESIALGSIFASDQKTGTLLAVFIGLQNLPEAFNSFRDMVLSGYGVKKTLVIFSFLSFSGIIGALIGHYFLSNYPDFTAYLMVFASGGILYLIFQDIAPASKMKESFIPSLGATGGFLVEMIGEKVI